MAPPEYIETAVSALVQLEDIDSTCTLQENHMRLALEQITRLEKSACTSGEVETLRQAIQELGTMSKDQLANSLNVIWQVADSIRLYFEQQIWQGRSTERGRQDALKAKSDKKNQTDEAIRSEYAKQKEANPSANEEQLQEKVRDALGSTDAPQQIRKLFKKPPSPRKIDQALGKK